jgi:hypothetical protein
VAHTETDDDPFQEGRHYPSTMQRWPDSDGPWQVTMDWKVVDGRIECVGLFIGAADGDRPITPGLVRGLKVGDLIRQGRADLTEQATAGAEVRRVGMRRSTRQRLEEVARVYRAAFDAGLPPARAVADQFGITAGGASSLVARAREAGLLPPTSPGAPQA